MPTWTCYISLIIPNADDARILLVPDADRWTLPRFTLDAIYRDLHLLQRAIRAELHAEMTVLRWLTEQVDENARETRGIWLMENHTPDWTPPTGAQWVTRAELDALTLADEGMRPTLEQAFNALLELAPTQRPLWSQMGWFTQARAWMTETLKNMGYTLLTPPEQYKLATISALLRAETTAGNVYFKVALALPLFGNEPKLSAALGQIAPQTIPAPIAIDAQRRWMLTADFGTQVRGSDPSPDQLEQIVTTYAQLQISTATQLDTLFEAGCLDRRLDVLAAQIDPLFADEACYSELNDDERALWQASAPRLKALCQQLAAYHVPYTLVHGDFHAANVAVQDERVLFFDWTDACVAHPFFDLPVFIDFDAQDHAERLRDAYLAQWTAYEPMAKLREAYTLASILGALHQAVSYQGILNGMEAEQRSAWIWAVPMFARSILKQLAELPA